VLSLLGSTLFKLVLTRDALLLNRVEEAVLILWLGHINLLGALESLLGQAKLFKDYLGYMLVDLLFGYCLLKDYLFIGSSKDSILILKGLSALNLRLCYS
jgi:hypothetical protein